MLSTNNVISIRNIVSTETTLHKNPFCILGVTTHDGRKKINEEAEDKSLILDEILCSKARTDLTNLRNRLFAEISWLPGVSPQHTSELIKLLENNTGAIEDQNDLSPLPFANLLAAALERIAAKTNARKWAEWIDLLAETVEEIDIDDIFIDINKDREISGFIKVPSLEGIEKALKNQKGYYKDVIKDAINRLPSSKLINVITNVVEVATNDGKFQACSLIKDLVDSYEMEVQEFLNQEKDNIIQLVEATKLAASRGLHHRVPALLGEIDKTVRNWHTVAQPMQLSIKSSGSTHNSIHEMSSKLANTIRSLGIDLFNEYNMIKAAQQLTKMLQVVFAELPEFVDRLDKDTSTLKNFASEAETNRHEIETQKTLTEKSDIIKKIVEEIRSTASRSLPNRIPSLLNKIDKILRDWNADAQTLQSSNTSSSIIHEMSLDLAYTLRNLAIELYNKYDLLDAAKQLTDILKLAFAELTEFVDLLDKDANTLNGIVLDRAKAQRETKKHAEEITYKTEIGTIVKKTLAISPEGVQWKKTIIPLQEITRVRWGATSHSINGIPTGTTHSVYFGDKYQIMHVEIKKEGVYGTFIDKLWRAVCVRLWVEMLQGMRDGKKYQFGDAIVGDQGVEITKSGFFSSGKKKYGTWSQLQTWNAGGNFVIGIKNDKKAYTAISYQDVDNTHILSAVINAGFKDGVIRLSDMLN